MIQLDPSVDLKKLSEQGKAVTRVVKRCERAKQNKKLGLDLSGNNLNSLPEGLKEITPLRRIDISQNSFNTLPTVIFAFKKLTHLHAQINYFQEIPTTHLDELHKLDTLKLCNFRSNPFNENAFKRLKEIKKFVVILSPEEETQKLHKLENL